MTRPFRIDPDVELPEKLQQARLAFEGEMGYIDLPWLSATEIDRLIEAFWVWEGRDRCAPDA